jgi:predicted dehydrogenase
LAACCDVTAERARDYCRDFGFVRSYTDLSAMLETEQPTALVLAVPPEVTCDVASQVLARGVPLLMEKPPGISLAEWARLVQVAEAGKARTQVGFNRRYMPVMRHARRILDAEFDRPLIGQIDYEMLRFDRWDRDFSTTAVHAIDAVTVLAGSPFRSARMTYQPFVQDRREAFGVSVDLECVSGTHARIEIQPVSGGNSESAKIHALGQSLLIKVPFPGKHVGDGAVEHWQGDELVSTFRDGGTDPSETMGIVAETNAFLAAVRSGTEPYPSLPDCHQQVALMEAIRRRETEVRAF